MARLMVLGCSMAIGSATATASMAAALARDVLGLPSSSATMTVSSDAFQPNQTIPAPYGQEGDNFSPSVAWASAPEGTRSFVVVMEDPDAKEPSPYVHWTIFNLPATTSRLAESIPALPQLPDLGKARQGRNSRGTIGYVGPRPPVGDPPHHYHFQVFALDTVLDLPPGAERDALLAAMRGHVLAAGEIIGTFQR